MRLALLFLLASLPARAQHVGPLYALNSDVLLVGPAVAVDDPGASVVDLHAPPARVNVVNTPTPAPAPVAADPVLNAVPPGAANLPAPVVADCSACARDLVPASKWPWWGTVLISIAASGAAVADHWLTRVAP